MKLLLAVLCVLALAHGHGAIHEKGTPCCGWAPSKNLALADEYVSFSFSVVEQNMDKIRTIVQEVSDPHSTRYGEYLTSAQIEEMTRPKKEDIATVSNWLAQNSVPFTVSNNGRSIDVKCPVSQAEKLLVTHFESLENQQTQQEPLIRATTYELPPQVEAATAAVVGLHGLPLPVRKPVVASSGEPGEPAKVTPAVLASTYSIGGVSPSGNPKNRQAVAEFQGQYEKDKDLADFFKTFVPHAKPGDEKVTKFVGDTDKQEAGVEASLDIQYIMGVAPHVQTEFWLFAGQDFCADLKNWTDTILSDDAAPLVHSVSYGWQGNLTQLECMDDVVSTIDDNFAKLAAKGITIIFASGDSGSGYTPARNQCFGHTLNATNHTMIVGDIQESNIAEDVASCCESAEGSAWTFVPPPAVSPWPTCHKGQEGPTGKVYEGTPIYNLRTPTVEECCTDAEEEKWYFSFIPGQYPSPGNCTIFRDVAGTRDVPGAYHGQPAQPLEGVCTTFTKVTGTKPQTNAISGGMSTTLPTLWPSWPASSPYVTAVGATRFTEQIVGNPEMATDQFGSGGGFSQMFNQSAHAQWQIEAVQKYVNHPPNDPHYPPAGSFPVHGRATPDVSALGEGYQVFTDGAAQSVGGTSASAPAFAGMVALLNEARMQKGEPAMGFLNPFLYQNADAFKDVTLGTNAIGRGDGPIKFGFNCTKGWDPATGLGTPIFPKLLSAALNATKKA
jgi:subtilase family serine protease